MSILCYHTLHPSWPSPLAVTPERFEQQASWLAGHRAVLDLPDALDLFDRRGRMPRGAVALTFDDGLIGVYDHALPVLRRLRLPATVYVVTRTLHDASAVDWIDDPPPPEGLACLDAEQILELRECGIRFGSHTVSHRLLPELTSEQCRGELRDSRQALEDLLHEPVTTLAYPRGRHDEAVRRAAVAAGYSHALALPERPEPRDALAIPRIGIYRDNAMRQLRMKLTRAYLPVRLRLPRRATEQRASVGT